MRMIGKFVDEQNNSDFKVEDANLYRNYIIKTLYRNYIIKTLYRNYINGVNLKGNYIEIKNYIRGVVCAETPFIYNFYIIIEDGFYIVIIYFSRNSSSSSRVKKLIYSFYIFFTGKWLQWE